MSDLVRITDSKFSCDAAPMFVFTDVGANVLDIAEHNVSNQTLHQEHSLCSIHVKELDWFKPVKGNISSYRKLFLAAGFF